MSLCAIMEHPSLSQSSSTFAIKCSWQIVNMFSNFAELVVVDHACYVVVLAIYSFYAMSICWVHA